jgi:hypothetical protein
MLACVRFISVLNSRAGQGDFIMAAFNRRSFLTATAALGSLITRTDTWQPGESYSALTFAALMTVVQRAISLFTRPASAWGPRPGLSGISPPSSCTRFRMFSSSNAPSSAPESLSRIDFGVRLGANRACQDSTLEDRLLWMSARSATSDCDLLLRWRRP